MLFRSRRRLVRAIEDSTIFGVKTNREFLVAALETPEFVQGNATTGFIGRHFPDGYRPSSPPFPVVALAGALLARSQRDAPLRGNGWIVQPMVLAYGDDRLELTVERKGEALELAGESERCLIQILDVHDHHVRYRIGERIFSARCVCEAGIVFLDVDGRLFEFADATYASATADEGNDSGILRAPMSGAIVLVDVAPGDQVVRGQALAVLEAMKMEHRITAMADGVVASVAVVPGMQVTARDVLITIDVAAQA